MKQITYAGFGFLIATLLAPWKYYSSPGLMIIGLVLVIPEITRRVMQRLAKSKTC